MPSTPRPLSDSGAPNGAVASAAGKPQAVLIAHGTGPKYPFQVLDAVTRGLSNSFRRAGYAVTVTHELGDRGATFDHRIALVATPDAADPSGAKNILKNVSRETRTLHLYELYWSPLTDRRASVTQILTWI